LHRPLGSNCKKSPHREFLPAHFLARLFPKNCYSTSLSWKMSSSWKMKMSWNFAEFHLMNPMN